MRPAIGGGPIDNVPLLIGFPIPDKIGGPNLRMHWLALLLPDNPALGNNRDSVIKNRADGWLTGIGILESATRPL